MWLQTTLGVFSIQQEENDQASGMLTVSAYCLDDLEAFVRKLLPECVIQYGDERRSHRYFVRAPQAKVGAAMALAVSDICYGDLIEAVRLTKGGSRTKYLMGVEYRLSEIRDCHREYHFDLWSIKNVEPEKILEVGCEGGAYTLWCYQHSEQNAFIVASNDCSGDWIDEDFVAQEKVFYSWDEAIRNMPKHWTSLYPLYVAPEFSSLVIKELRLQGIDAEQHSDWKLVLQVPKLYLGEKP